MGSEERFTLKREIQIDANWRESLVWALLVLVIGLTLVRDIHEFLTVSSHVVMLNWYVGVETIYLGLFFYSFRDRRPRVAFAFIFGSIVVRALAQFLIRNSDSAWSMIMTARFFHICGMILILVFFISEAGKKVRVVEIDHNA